MSKNKKILEDKEDLNMLMKFALVFFLRKREKELDNLTVSQNYNN